MEREDRSGDEMTQGKEQRPRLVWDNGSEIAVGGTDDTSRLRGTDEPRYHVGDHICFWFGDSVHCGVIEEIDERSDVPHYETLMDTTDGEPHVHQERWTVREDDDIWLERDGPSPEMRAKIKEWYDGNPPKGLLVFLS